MPFLKDFIINPRTKIKLWKLNLGELDYFELDEYDSNLIKAKKNNWKPGNESNLAKYSILDKWYYGDKE